MRSIHLADTAAADLEDIWAYYFLNTNADKANAFVDALTQRLGILADQPLMGRERPEFGAGLRSLVLDDYLAIYMIDGGKIMIVRVLHGARDITRTMKT
jgi:toxin ParE1/3/4